MSAISREEIKKWIAEKQQGINAEELSDYFMKADKPLLDDSDRVEVIMLVIDNDRAEALECIKGVFNTTYPFKLTIYDNKRNPHNTSKIWNKLIRESNAEFVMLIDSDVIPQNDIITPMVEALTIKDVIASAPTGTGALPIQQQLSKEIKEPIDIGPNVSGCCFMIRKSLLEKAGYFDEDFFFYGQDSEWFERINRLRYKALITPKASIQHGHSVSSSRLKDKGIFDPVADSKVAHVICNAKIALS